MENGAVSARRRLRVVIPMMMVTVGLVVGCTVEGTGFPTQKGLEEAAVPNDLWAATVAPGARELSARIRGADPCAVMDREFLARFGKVVTSPIRQAQRFTQCQVLASTGDPSAPQVRFRIDLGDFVTKYDRRDKVEIRVGGKLAFQQQDAPGSNVCSIELPYGSSGFGASLNVNRHIAGRGSDQAPWPEACAVAREYLTLIADRVLADHFASAPLPGGTRPVYRSDTGDGASCPR